MEPILSAHDHDDFEITCYANVARPDCVTERLQGHADRWRSLVGMSDADAAEELSVIPGLGHIYKGHKLTGALLMAGALIIIGMSVVFATSTVLASLLMLPTYWIGVMLHVYWAEDIAAAKMPKPHKQM